jgi:hypothetical protein
MTTGMLETGGDQRVRLSVSDKLTSGGMLLGQLVLLGGIGIGMWTRLALVEQAQQHTTEAVQDLRGDVKQIQQAQAARP